MFLLPLFVLCVTAFSQCRGDVLSNAEIEEDLKNILYRKLDRLIEIKKEVEGILKEAEEHSQTTNNQPELEGIPKPCLSLLQATTKAPCPDFNALVAQLRVVIVDITQVITNGVKVFNETFSSSSYQCSSTYNPFTALRCFLRAFRAAYDNLSSLTNEVTKAKNDAQEMYKEYIRYKNQCKDETKNTMNFLSICKRMHSVNSS